MTSKTREITIGAIVVATGAVLFGWLYAGHAASKAVGYDLIARFNRAEGVHVGSEVRLSGMSVGRVVAQGLDKNYRAVLTLRLDPKVQVTADTAAVIQTDGLLGSKFIALQPGADEAMLKPGAEVQYTQDSVNVEDLMALIIAQAKAKRAEEAAAAKAPPPACSPAAAEPVTSEPAQGG